MFSTAHSIHVQDIYAYFLSRLFAPSQSFKMKRQKTEALEQLKKRFSRISFPHEVGNLDVKNEM